MKAEDANRLEASVRNANPVPHADALIDSEESAAVTFRLLEATEKDVPGLLPVPPEVERRERGLTMETAQSAPVAERKRPIPLRAAAFAFAVAVFVAAVIGVGAIVMRDDPVDVATPAPPEITFDDPERALFTYETEIRQLIEDTYAQAAPLLDVEGIAFVVSLEVYGLAVPDYGVGWMPADENTVVIAIDPYLPQLSEVLPERVPVMVADALYGSARYYGGVSDETLFDSIVTSGLITTFTEEVYGLTPPWADAFPADQTEDFMAQARPVFDTRWDAEADPELSWDERFAVSTVFDTWLHYDPPGSEWRTQQGVDVPQWAGHTLGYRLIKDYLTENPGQTAADLVTTPASVFLP